MKASSRTIPIRTEAPAKPETGGACNGCGVCCLVQPCPLGMLLSLRMSGPCSALRWSALHNNYRCGAMSSAPALIRKIFPWLGRAWMPALAQALVRLATRWVAAGTGCDCNLTVERVDVNQIEFIDNSP